MNSWSGQHPYEWHCGTHTPREEYEDQGVPPAWPSQHPDQWVSSGTPQPVIPRHPESNTLLFYLCLNIVFPKSKFSNSLTCNWGNGCPCYDTAPPAGLELYCITLVACQAPSHENMLSSPMLAVFFSMYFFFFAAVPKIRGRHASQILFPLPS